MSSFSAAMKHSRKHKVSEDVHHRRRRRYLNRARSPENDRARLLGHAGRSFRWLRTCPAGVGNRRSRLPLRALARKSQTSMPRLSLIAATQHPVVTLLPHTLVPRRPQSLSYSVALGQILSFNR